MASNKKSGVYKITCVPTGKFYIGSSINVNNRWLEHKSALRREKHHSIYLQRAWYKYGKDNFTFEVIEECKESEVLIIEQKWLDILHPYKKDIGYNLSSTATISPGVSKEYIITFPDGHEECIINLNKFCREYGISKTCIRGCLNGVKNDYKGFKCRKIDQTKEDMEKIKSSRLSKSKNWGTCQGYVNRIWIIIKPNGEKLEVKSLQEFCKNNNLTISNMCKVANGEIRHHKGYKCYRDGKVPEIQSLPHKRYLWEITHPNGNIEIISNLKKFCRDNKISRNKMQQVVSGKIDHIENYRCRPLAN